MLILFLSISHTTAMTKRAKEMGFSFQPCVLQSKGKFTLPSGPRRELQELSPFEVLKLVFNNQFIKLLLNSAINNQIANIMDEDISEGSLWSYFASVLGHGICQFAEERQAYTIPSNSTANIFGLLGNGYLHNHFTFAKWQQAKQLYASDRNDMTKIYNNVCKELWCPYRYIFY